MFARVSTLQGSPDGVEAGIASAREEVWPGVQKLEGCKGMIALGDRTSGKMIAITLWETEDALKASEEAATQLRDASAETASAQVANVERFEVVFDERM